MVRRLLVVLVLSAVAGGGNVSPASAASDQIRLKSGISRLVVGSEYTGTYDRADFRHWVDADRDGCDTREEVLLAEARRKPRRGPGCRLSGGAWKSLYDGRMWTDKSDVDVDHVVALAEAWDSGAHRWNADTRTRFANDLYGRTLRAVTDNVNQAKSDQDPADWLPTRGRCRYVADVVAIKLRWRLSVDPRELSAIRTVSHSCRNVKMRVPRATVVLQR